MIPVRRPKVLAISSGGGHWIQLLRLRPAFAESDLTFVTVKAAYRVDVREGRFLVVPDSNRWNKFALARSALCIFWLLLRERPDVIVTTGAAPGYFAVRFGKWLGCRTVWIDSVANAETLSLSGKHAGRHVDLWLTQWPHLAADDGPYYRGNVL